MAYFFQNGVLATRHERPAAPVRTEPKPMVEDRAFKKRVAKRRAKKGYR